MLLVLLPAHVPAPSLTPSLPSLPPHPMPSTQCLNTSALTCWRPVRCRRKKDHGRAEALLMAIYGLGIRMHPIGGQPATAPEGGQEEEDAADWEVEEEEEEEELAGAE